MVNKSKSVEIRTSSRSDVEERSSRLDKIYETNEKLLSTLVYHSDKLRRLNNEVIGHELCGVGDCEEDCLPDSKIGRLEEQIKRLGEITEELGRQIERAHEL